MKVVILCGGFGTRIRDVSQELPKPMVPIGGRPILWHVMKYYAAHGFNEFVLCLGYRGDAIKDYFLNYQAHTSDFTLSLDGSAVEYHRGHDEHDWKITFAETGLNTMTGGRVARIARYVDGDTFMLTYGDGVGDVDLAALLAFHRAHGKAMTVTGVRPPGRFGEVDASDDGLIAGFNEKPQTTGGWISGGFFVCDKRVFDYLDPREDLVLEREPMRNLVADGELMLYRHHDFWQCMDTYRDYKLLDGLIEQGKAPWISWR
ncbi:MAG: glucose-1-phosphate cytidylyltransferase [Deltaproteobacteria bacterium HGW-Deltaproteobacteria-14]|jgi:glucose-1-phosphate cytidylyltransferase|nr:MAG: glucose-1-phosphate cytidylyltransferase [Deltaproteobacteria bacterium HGW-Deltaproteobacteria-14]